MVTQDKSEADNLATQLAGSIDLEGTTERERTWEDDCERERAWDMPEREIAWVDTSKGEIAWDLIKES